MSTGSESTPSYTISNLTNESTIYPTYGDYVNAAVLVFLSMSFFCSHTCMFAVTLKILLISYLPINAFSTI